MAIKEAKQSGNSVLIKYGNTTKQLQGTLIGYTQKAVYVKFSKNLQIYIEKNGSVVGSGHNIALLGNEDVIMCGNLVGVKKGNRINLYGEDGRPAGSRQV